MRQALDFLRGFGRALHAENDHVLREPLPQRWIDLIRYLNEKERQEEEQRRRPFEFKP